MTHAPRPLISIVTATYNAEKVLPALARSLRGQGYRNYEWAVIDGQSTDGTVELVRSLKGEVTHFLSEPDKGTYDAWNKALDLVRGEWIIFLGADDRVGDSWLEVVAAEGNKTDAGVIYGDVLMVDGGSGVSLGAWRGRPWSVMRDKLQNIPHPGLAHRACLFANARFDLRYRIRADYEFLVRANIRIGRYVPGTNQAVMATGGLSNKPVNIRRSYSEAREILEKHKLAMSLAERLIWEGKVALSYVPRVYAAVQRMRWKVTRGNPSLV